MTVNFDKCMVSAPSGYLNFSEYAWLMHTTNINTDSCEVLIVLYTEQGKTGVVHAALAPLGL